MFPSPKDYTSFNLLIHSAAQELPTNVGSSDDVVKGVHCSKNMEAFSEARSIEQLIEEGFSCLAGDSHALPVSAPIYQ